MYVGKALFLKITIFPDYQKLENTLDTFKLFLSSVIFNEKYNAQIST